MVINNILIKSLFTLLVFSLLLVSKNLTAAEVNSQSSTEWFALFLADKKSGFSKIERNIQDGEVITTVTSSMHINRNTDVVIIDSIERNVETLKGEALSFEYSQIQGNNKTFIKGEIRDHRIADIEITSGGRTTHQQQTWDSSYLLSEGQRLKMIAANQQTSVNGIPQTEKKDNSIGVKHFSFNTYDTSSAEVVPTHVEMRESKLVDLLGRVVKLTEQKHSLHFGKNIITVHGYFDTDFKLKKMVWPMMGTTLEIISTSKEYALSPNEPSEFFTQGFTHSPVNILPEQLQRALEYKIMPKHDNVSFLTTSEQKIKLQEADVTQIVLQIAPIIDARGEFPYQGDDKAILAYLKPNRWVQSDDASIIDLAREIVANKPSAGEAAKAIEIFVRQYIDEKTLSVGYASALEVLDSRQGDCTEHALLVVALLKAAGIPARVATGLAYADNFAGKEQVFVPHAWAQAYIDQQWVSYDAALNGFDSSHLTLGVGDGDPIDFFDILNTLGNFDITSVSTK